MTLWPSVRIGDLAKVASGYAFKSSEFKDAGVPVIKIKNVRVGSLDLTDGHFVDAGYVTLPARYHSVPGDILISLTGSHLTQPNSVVGRVARHGEDVPRCLINQRVGKFVVRDENVCHPGFLFRALSTFESTRAVAMMAQGAASQANVSPTQVESLIINLPPISIQHRIDQVLGAYDDLIAVNQRRVAILEEMARGLFEEWFVHLRFPGHENATIVDAPEGAVPDTWTWSTVGELGILRSGNNKLTKAAYCSEGVVAYSASGPDGFVAEVGCTGAAVVVSAVGAYCGKTWLADGDWTMIANTFAVFPRDRVPCEFLYLSTLGIDKWPRRGAAQPFIAKADAASIPIRRPTDSVLDGFRKVASPVLRLVAGLLAANKLLAASRDHLLPRLIAGQLSVAQAEVELAQAA